MTGGSPPERSVDGPSPSPSTTTTTTTTNDLPRAAGEGGGGPPSASRRETMDRAPSEPPADPASSSNIKTTDATGDGGSPPRAGPSPSLTVSSSFFGDYIFFMFFLLSFLPRGEYGILDYGASGTDDLFRSDHLLFVWSGCLVLLLRERRVRNLVSPIVQCPQWYCCP
jgi:hypothetical protein